MCTLLAGKRKAEVQELLLELGIIPALIQMFDRMDWTRPSNSTPPFERLHGPGCECNPESALRIQYLRLVHNLCDMEFDHSKLKHQMLSAQEIASVQRCACLFVRCFENVLRMQRLKLHHSLFDVSCGPSKSEHQLLSAQEIVNVQRGVFSDIDLACDSDAEHALTYTRT